MANILTCLRILCSIVLLFCTPFSKEFYLLYIAAALSDMLDGPVARKTGKASDSGRKLDTAADFVFVAAVMIKLLPVLNIPGWILAWICIIASVKVVNIIQSFAIEREFPAVHSLLNRITGILLFLLPLTVPVIELKYSAVPVCVAATAAALSEGRIIRRNCAQAKSTGGTDCA